MRGWLVCGCCFVVLLGVCVFIGLLAVFWFVLYYDFVCMLFCVGDLVAWLYLC